MQISVIIKTYNWPEALSLVLKSLDTQKTNIKFEVIVADDGSDARTLDLINNLRANLNYPLKHVWHEDRGFRASKILNKAITQAKGDFCVFTDGDCICPKNFVHKHAKLAEKKFFTSGSRILISEEQSKKVIQRKDYFKHFSLLDMIKLRITKNCNRISPIVPLPFKPFRKLFPNKWKNSKSCNLGIWREDLLKVNGFDESYEGWGHEDSDLIIRLINSGVKRKSGKLEVTVFHLGHPLLDRSKQKNNFVKLMQALKSKRTKPVIGIE
jgi:glycosyltransferase involved in cell wall biosynthesis